MTNQKLETTPSSDAPLEETGKNSSEVPEPTIKIEVDRRHPNACAPVECNGEHETPVKHGDHIDYHVGHAHHHRHGDHCDLHGCC